MTKAFRIYLWVSGGFALICLVFMNDLTTVLPGAELQVLSKPVATGLQWNPFVLLIQSIRDAAGLELFFLRLPAVLLYLGAIALTYIFGRRIFGPDGILHFLIVLVTSLLLLTIQKFAVADGPLFSFQLVYALSLLLFVKTAKASWRWIMVLSGLFIVAMAPLSGGIYVLLMWLGFRLFHPQRERLGWGIGIVGLAAAAVGLYASGADQSAADYYYFSVWGTSYQNYLIAVGLGFIAWIGWLPAALWDTIKRLRKGEEMAMVMSIWLVVGLLAHSIVVLAPLAFIIGRQIRYFLDRRYPHGNLVKTFVLINLVATFCLVTVSMISTYYRIGAVGFRSVMAVSAVYWIFQFLGILGLFARSRGMLLTGFTLSGLLACLMFWIQLNPLLEISRSWPRVVAKEVDKMQGTFGETALSTLIRDNSQIKMLDLYLSENQNITQLSESETSGGVHLILGDSIALEERFPERSLGTPVFDISGQPAIWNTSYEKLWIVEEKSK